MSKDFKIILFSIAFLVILVLMCILGQRDELLIAKKEKDNIVFVSTQNYESTTETTTAEETTVKETTTQETTTKKTEKVTNKTETGTTTSKNVEKTTKVQEKTTVQETT